MILFIDPFNNSDLIGGMAGKSLKSSPVHSKFLSQKVT